MDPSLIRSDATLDNRPGTVETKGSQQLVYVLLLVLGLALIALEIGVMEIGVKSFTMTLSPLHPI